eukprot:gene13103-13231_t
MAQLSRPYDSLYDPNYTVSGARDHYKQQSAGFLIEKVPEHANLFSDLQQYPTSTFRIKGNDRLPAFLDRSFHPQQQDIKTLQWQSDAQQVSGRQQYKFVRRPHLHSNAQTSPAVHYAAPAPVPAPAPPAPPEPLTKSAATQSDYRESETQTLPWSPDWVLPKDPGMLAKQAVLSAKYMCQGPELLALANLKFGDGLPGGLQEVRRLEKLRQKRAFEASLPPIDDAERLPERQALIEAWEANEWAEREEEIKGVQDERLALLEQALQVREEEIEEAHRSQVAQRSAMLLSGKASKFAGIHASRIKTIRQLATKRKQVDTISRKQQPSIIDKYADFASSVYAPPQREGRFPDAVRPAGGLPGTLRNFAAMQQMPAHVDADMLTPSTLAGLQQLESSLPGKILQPKMYKPKVPAKLNYQQRVEAAVCRDVETISMLLNTAKAADGGRCGQVWPHPANQPPTAAGSAASSRASRPSSTKAGGGSSSATLANMAGGRAAGRPGAGAGPTLQGAGDQPEIPEAPPLPDDDGTHAALVLLQRLLRGRAVQNEMYAGMMAHHQLVRELRLELEGTAGGLN